jgi:hypothetical protein
MRNSMAANIPIWNSTPVTYVGRCFFALSFTQGIIPDVNAYQIPLHSDPSGREKYVRRPNRSVFMNRKTSPDRQNNMARRVPNLSELVTAG